MTRKDNTTKKKLPLFKSRSNSLFRFSRQVKKEFKLLWTDKFNIFLALVLPPMIIFLIAFTTGVEEEISPINCVVVTYDSNMITTPNNYTEYLFNNITDFSHDNYSYLYLNAVNNSQYLTPLEYNNQFYLNATTDIYAMETARNYLAEGHVSVIIVIPIDFSEMLTLGLPAFVNCIVDGSSVLTLQDNLNAVLDSVNVFVSENNLTPQIELVGFEEFSVPKNLNFKFNAMVTFILPIMAFGLPIVLTILVIVKEKPIARLLLTPVKRAEILLSKYVTYSAILAIQTLLLIVSSVSQGLYCVGSYFDLFLALFMLGFSALALGLFISTISKTKTEANQYFFMSFILIIVLSGLFIPIDSMPLYLQVVAWILPLSHAGPMINNVLTKGMPAIGFDFYCLLAVSSVLFALSVILFQRKQYEA
ncbi:MAG: ABC transporter permease [Candidatus Lokiarchaeota archaeon]|nr:ABC transporter permease [Candidatus Lokiarchaeota archaeon]